jgi:hypothetical protein
MVLASLVIKNVSLASVLKMTNVIPVQIIRQLVLVTITIQTGAWKIVPRVSFQIILKRFASLARPCAQRAHPGISAQPASRVHIS